MDDKRWSMTPDSLVMKMPQDDEERISLLALWVLLMRFPHPRIFDRAWRCLELTFPRDVAEARARVNAADLAQGEPQEQQYATQSNAGV